MSILSDKIDRELKKALERTDHNQSELARKMGIAPPFLNKYLNGDAKTENLTIKKFETMLPHLKGIHLSYDSDMSIRQTGENCNVVQGSHNSEKNYHHSNIADHGSTITADALDSFRQQLNNKLLDLDIDDPAKIKVMQLIRQL